MKHLIQQPHIILSVENPLYQDKAQIAISHDGAIKYLNKFGKENVYSISGHYGSPEKSILISNPTDHQVEAARSLSFMTGQDSHIESNGHAHKLLYNFGNKAGQIETGEGTVFHKEKPQDYFSTLPDGTHFTHNFENLDKSELSKGLKGDWKKEGYILHHSDMPDSSQEVGHHLVTAKLNGKTVGQLRYFKQKQFGNTNPELYVGMVEVLPKHRRKGLASAMHVSAEARHGAKFTESSEKTNLGQKLWNRPNRPFGKTLHKKQEAPDQKNLPKLSKQTPKVNLNPEHGRKIADAYHNMKHDPNNPEVKAAYGALIDETKQQYQDLLNQGFKFTKVTDPKKYPYKNSKEMHQDIEQNKHLYYLPTEDGSFGPETSAPKDHPLLAPTQFQSHDGKPMLANCLLRQVHDVNGHFYGGKTTFGPAGEHQAYLHHKKMYSEKAQPALANELIMQNSYVNFGPHGEHNRKNPANTIYAPQKVGLVPEWVWKGKWHE